MSGESIPTVKLERVILRRLRLEDDRDILETYSDAEAMKYRQNPPLTSLAEADRMIRQSWELANAGISVRWAIQERTATKVIGTFLWRIGGADAHHLIGYSLHKAWWGRGLMTDVVTAMTAHLFARHGMEVIRAQVDKENLASVRLLERTGFTRIKESPKGRLTFELRAPADTTLADR